MARKHSYHLDTFKHRVTVWVFTSLTLAAGYGILCLIYSHPEQAWNVLMYGFPALLVLAATYIVYGIWNIILGGK